MEWDGKKFSIDNDQILLRGAVLRNTSWCYGVVIFAGKDTKLMQNSGKSKFKRTSIDRLLNFIILGVSIAKTSICRAWKLCDFARTIFSQQNSMWNQCSIYYQITLERGFHEKCLNWKWISRFFPHCESVNNITFCRYNK